MIIDNIILFLFTPVTFLVSLLPTADVDILGIITGSVADFRSSLITINWFFPVNLALAFLSIVFSIEALLFLWKSARYIIGLFTFGVTK